MPLYHFVPCLDDVLHSSLLKVFPSRLRVVHPAVSFLSVLVRYRPYVEGAFVVRPQTRNLSPIPPPSRSRGLTEELMRNSLSNESNLIGSELVPLFHGVTQARNRCGYEVTLRNLGETLEFRSGLHRCTHFSSRNRYLSPSPYPIPSRIVFPCDEVLSEGLTIVAMSCLPWSPMKS